MELKIESEIKYSGEDMKNHIIGILEMIGYDYIVDNGERMITVLKNSQRRTVDDISAEQISQLFELILLLSPIANIWESMFPQATLSPDDDLFKNLNKNQKLDILKEVISRYTSGYLTEFYISKVTECIISNKVKLADETLEIISKYYNIGGRIDK